MENCAIKIKLAYTLLRVSFVILTLQATNDLN